MEEILTVFGVSGIIAALLGLITYGSFAGLFGTLVIFVVLGIIALLGWIPFIGVALYFYLALEIVMPYVYSWMGIASSWITITILIIHGILSLALSLKMFF